MRLQVIVATVNQKDFSLLKKMNIQSDVIIANQCGKNESHTRNYKNYSAYMVSSDTIGVGKNRNIGLIYADADIILFADDDVRYRSGYVSYILQEFEKYPDADGIFFRFQYTKNGEVFHVDPEKKGQKRLHIYNVMKYGTCNLAVRRSAIQKYSMNFSELFGGGSLYGSGEDSLFILDMLRMGCKFYCSNKIIGKTAQDKSSWFTGYNKKYFYDIGAFIACAFPKTKYMMKWYYLFRFWKLSEVPIWERYRQISRGMSGFKYLRRYSS